MTTTPSHFDFFEGATSQHTEPQITVRRGGLMVLTQGAVDMLGDDVTHIQFGFDEATKAVALRAAPADAKGRYRLRHQKNGSTRLVDGKRFIQHNGLRFDKATRFDVESFGDGLIGFKLDLEPAEKKTAEDKPAEKKPAPAKKAATRKTAKA